MTMPDLGMYEIAKQTFWTIREIKGYSLEYVSEHLRLPLTRCQDMRQAQLYKKALQTKNEI